MRSYFLALSFLTVLPVKNTHPATEEEMEKSLYYYPLVGLTLGVILTAFAWVVYNIGGLGLAGDVLVVALLIILSGGLHMDGLMDTSDGLMSGKEGDRKLEIMKDSRVGAMGAIACLVVLMLKITLLAELPVSQKLWALLLFPVAGRWACVYGITRFEYARTRLGGKSLFSLKNKNMTLAVASVVLVLIAFLVFKWTGLLLVILVLLFAHIIYSVISKVIGGLTGDTYGALVELTETWVLLLIVVIGKVMLNG